MPVSVGFSAAMLGHGKSLEITYFTGAKNLGFLRTNAVLRVYRTY